MPIINIKIVEGRTVEQKRELIKNITETVATTINVPKEAVWITIEDLKPENLGQGGILRKDK